MKFSVSAVLAFAAAVLAQPVLLNSNYQITEGEPFTLKWGNAQGPVTVTLMTGDSKNLKEVTDLTTGVTDSEYTFTLTDLPSGTYAIKITDDSGTPNYSPQFQYQGSATLTSSTSRSASVSRTSTRASTSNASSSSSSESESTSTTSSEASSSTSSFTTTTSQAPSTTRGATTTPTSTIPDLNNGQRFASPLGFVLVTVAALIFFN
ncbi:Ser-Thr-rich glycosyl-phosphatidyl-inositol-anchored membrane family-domain-containing protein [Parachaetomium inaequale]|uniref:Ser-Thr-rich glycosyl-phosphatidyl-inositol-anchored membrane family-domain-containing protein n=1 Tax=Parachaetomium inaequale TaxID=2588326 RepID=A0AAN6PMW2_9PEZI|nr:Ser-Thr-rich glycosyl-phosphatidyl-inositol-anchored membrane family-domain-containing protein [Parachaetomium inaequale]